MVNQVDLGKLYNLDQGLEDCHMAFQSGNYKDGSNGDTGAENLIDMNRNYLEFYKMM